MQPIKAVLFDMDGTIINTIDDLAAASNHTMEALGFSGHTVAQYKLMVGNGIPKLVERALPPGHRDEATKAEALEVFLDYYREHAADLPRAYDGVPELVATLKQKGYRLAVVTNKVEEMALRLLDDLYPGLFDVCIGQRPALPPKPDPAAAKLAMEELGVTPEECVFVGDSGVDVKTAENAGAYPVGVLWGFRDEPELRENGARAVIRRPEELLTLLSDNNAKPK